MVLFPLILISTYTLIIVGPLFIPNPGDEKCEALPLILTFTATKFLPKCGNTYTS